MLDLRILNGAQALPLFDLPALLGRKQAAREVGDQIEALIAFMDELGGDPDLEEDDDAGTDLDRGEGGAWIEQHRGTMKGGDYEDDEDSDPAEDDNEDCCKAGDDEVRSGNAPMYRAYYDNFGIGDTTDAEPRWCGSFAMDAEAGLFAANDV